MALPTGSLPQDFATFLRDLAAQVDPTQLRQDLTAVVTDLKSSHIASTDLNQIFVGRLSFDLTHPNTVIVHIGS